MSSDNYLFLLDERGEPYAAKDLDTWAKGCQYGAAGKAQVGRETVGSLLVSTIFLWMNAEYGDGPPILWETMIFCDGNKRHPLHHWQKRCSGARERAEAMHAEAVKLARGTVGKEAAKA